MKKIINEVTWMGTIHVVDMDCSNDSTYNKIVKHYQAEIDKHDVVAFESSKIPFEVLDGRLHAYAFAKGKKILFLDENSPASNQVVDEFTNLIKNYQSLSEAVRMTLRDISFRLSDMSLDNFLSLDEIELGNFLNENELSIQSVWEDTIQEWFTDGIITEEDRWFFQDNREYFETLKDRIMNRDKYWNTEDATLVIVGAQHVFNQSI